jgi:hypothetical protein
MLFCSYFSRSKNYSSWGTLSWDPLPTLGALLSHSILFDKVSCFTKKKKESIVLVRHQWCRPVILATWEDGGTSPAQANSLRHPTSKITAAKWTGGVTEVVEHLLSECKTLTSKPSPTKKK